LKLIPKKFGKRKFLKGLDGEKKKKPPPKEEPKPEKPKVKTEPCMSYYKKR